jgi:hypothetical protein
MNVSDLIPRIKQRWKAWREPAPPTTQDELLLAIHAIAGQRWFVKALLRYKLSGTGPVAQALSDDSQRLAVEQAFVGRMTDCVLSRRGVRL